MKVVAKAVLRMRMKGILVFSGIGRTRPRGISFGRLRRSQAETSQRVSVSAVKTLVTMPRASVTAKPRTGPEPRKNSTTAAISVVTLASMMVPSALWKPASMDFSTELPVRRSSRTRS